MFWLVLSILALWLILGSLAKVTAVVFWVVVIGLLVAAGAAGIRYLNDRKR